jgi:hypothetical protein
MSIWKKIARSNFVIRARHWEYWPFGIVQFPVILYWLWLCVKARSLLFFSASNPAIPMGGMFGESKFEILKKIPARYTPKTIRINLPTTATQVLSAMAENGLKFPVIFKPDLGERGFMVERIANADQVQRYLSRIKIDFLVQELIDLPCEYGVYYRKFPDQERGAVVSVVSKEMLTVTGDGISTLQQLIMAKDRAKLQWKKLKDEFASRLDEVIPQGKKIELVSIGNHARGTKFLDGSDLINDRLSATFHDISSQIGGFYYGRYDLRCASEADLYNGKIFVVELNGCGAELAHIYQPGFSLLKAVGVMMSHWKNIYEIARMNNKRGVQYVTLKEAYAYYKKFKAATTP